MSFNGDPEGALVTFSSHAEAQAAYRSTEAALNNRFIKVFWHNKDSPDSNQENVPTMFKTPVKDRLGCIVNLQRALVQLQTVISLNEAAAVKEATKAKEKERRKVI